MQNVMCTLGTDFHVTPEKQLSVEAFVCAMYGKASFQSVNEWRYHLFCTRTTQSSQLPPTKDALSKHVLRANYHASSNMEVCFGGSIQHSNPSRKWIVC